MSNVFSTRGVPTRGGSFVASYDISMIEARVYTNARQTDNFTTATLATFLAFWALLMVFYGPVLVGSWVQLSRGLVTLWLVLVAFGTAVVIALGAVVFDLLITHLKDGLPHGWRGPIRLDVDGSGLTLGWDRGPPLRRRWDESRGPIRVEDYSEQGPGYGSKLMISRFLRLPLWVAITNEAAAGLAREAERVELHVQTEDVFTSLGAHGRCYLISRDG
jgi:hypothetical protein